MRVKLSYTVEEEDVLAETAKLINLCAGDMQQIIDLFNNSQKELKGESDEIWATPPPSTGVELHQRPININKCLGILHALRRSLYNVDIRVAEAIEIVGGYDEYKRSESLESAPASLEGEPELFGAD
jgi:hypothetical protein